MSLCECTSWARDGGLFLTTHHRNCEKYEDGREISDVVRALLDDIEQWASEEDGIPESVYGNYSRVRAIFGPKRVSSRAE
jgi:hypothetical protein